MKPSDRLTKVQHTNNGYISAVELLCHNDTAMFRLAEYEDTGLSPDEVSALIKYTKPYLKTMNTLNGISKLLK